MQARQMSLYYNITEACGNACLFCASDSLGWTDHRISTDDVCRSLAGYALTKKDMVIINGGEPTAHPGFHRILDAAVATGARVILFTNGRALADPNTVATFRLHRLHRISIPLYAARPEVHDRMVGRDGAWAQTMAGLANVMILRAASTVCPDLELKLLAVRPSLAEWPDIVNRVAGWPNRPQRAVLSGLILSQALLHHRSELIPTMEQLAGPLNETMRRLRAIGTPLILLWSIPPCLLDVDNLAYYLGSGGDGAASDSRGQVIEMYHDYRYPRGIELSSGGNSEADISASACRTCKLSDRCDGMPQFLMPSLGN
jgi:pyruvate-formate lyase-activating enzyme